LPDFYIQEVMQDLISGYSTSATIEIHRDSSEIVAQDLSALQ
jgi:hypothetical protein